MPGSEPLLFRHRRATWEDWAPAVLQIAVPIALAAPCLMGYRPPPWFLGVIAGALFIAARTALRTARVCLSARNASVAISDDLLRLTDWRGRARELNWNDVSLNMGTSKVQIAAGDQMLMEVGAREFEDGYRLINELAQHVRAAQKAREEKATVNIIPFPPGYFDKQGL